MLSQLSCRTIPRSILLSVYAQCGAYSPLRMTDPMVDQMNRLKLRLLEKRLEKERDNAEGRAESGLSTRSFDNQLDTLHSALRRKQDLLQRLREQHRLEYQNRPRTWGGTWRSYCPDHLPPPAPLLCPPAPIHQPASVPPPVLPPAPAAPRLPPNLIQHMWPQQPATILQQLPAQQPLIQQIPPPQIFPAPRSGSIKEDMVELMLMQNAQMHQIIMHNMMLRAMPPMAQSPPNPGPVKQRGNAVHHHHYGPQAYTLPPIGSPMWPSMRSSQPAGQGGAQMPSVQHVSGPITLPPLNIY
ncbi:uncharacterized protein C21orf58 isoform X2 [Esox lucius]|uniref:uncharacterized protein C21orf58 isoform X2 n=1 Tax=Esox lucius TaxID=8010 RepID=UPI00147741BC|nr:uncharacterized protein C21orf58 isoform X2 [Esox lucius]